ncbi:Mor transcription activator family protein [Luteibacter sp.]|jgi:Mor family transcriptional regulator|uniref:Mor transcription activator family protein n=1 Tax=Luteibacter sp. TaxID=1886636 RepID=UPI002F40AE4C
MKDEKTSIDTADMFGDDGQLDADKVIDSLKQLKAHHWEGNVGKLLKAVKWVLNKHLGPERAADLSPEVVMSAIDELGGHIVYWPKGEVLKRALRDIEIATEHFDQGCPIEQLVNKYKLTPQRIYTILAAQREIRRRSGPDLFGFGERG